jgi:uncharacterized iron-regulated protein
MKTTLSKTPVPSKFMCAVLALSCLVSAPAIASEIPQEAREASVVVLGEQHDNPAHHARQANWVSALAPKALVFEMLTERQAARAGIEWSTQDELDAAIEWTASAWPSFDMYFPIFAAAPDAVIYGANVPRETLRKQLKMPLIEHPNAQQFGLDHSLIEVEQVAREEVQAVAHCGALPEEMLPVMVSAQRLRDAALSDAALRALTHTGGPVVVITGNGHARADWGVPALIAYAAPEVSVFSLGQSEDGQDLSGAFTLILDAPSPERSDPCAAFTQ